VIRRCSLLVDDKDGCHHIVQSVACWKTGCIADNMIILVGTWQKWKWCMEQRD